MSRYLFYFKVYSCLLGASSVQGSPQNPIAKLASLFPFYQRGNSESLMQYSGSHNKKACNWSLNINKKPVLFPA